MIKNLFVARTPLQLINMIEAREHFKTKKNILIVIYHDMNKNQSELQLKDLIKHEDWDEVLEFERTQSTSKFLTYLKIIKEAKKNVYEYIFIGDLGAIQRQIVANCNKKYLFLVDDGVLTIAYYKNNFQHEKKKGVDFKKLRYMIFGLKTDFTDSINLFTIFNLLPKANVKVIQNNFNYLKQNVINKLKQSDEIYFLGQKLVEVGMMDKDIYFAYIKKIIKYFKGSTIIYIPHRGETGYEELRSLESENFKIKKVNKPIEIYFATDGILPKHVASFNTSALFTIDKLFDKSKLSAFKIDENHLKMFNSEVNECYNFLKNTKCEIIELKDVKK